MFFPFSNFGVSSMWCAFGVPPIKIPIDVTTFVWYLLPPVVCYLAVALLAVTPETRAIRGALCPVVALLALRAVASVDLSFGNPKQTSPNVNLAVTMFCVVFRTVDWAMAEKPLVRDLRPENDSPSTIMDALDLCFNFRGHGWNWSCGVHIPRETRPSNRLAFVFCSLLYGIMHIFICGSLQRAVASFDRVEAGPNTLSIFDDTLHLTLRCIRSSIISVLYALVLYSLMQMGYNLCTVPAILLIRQDPAQWRPAFDAPWRATSLNDFWSRRWHQWFRRPLVVSGGHLLSPLLGRTGTVLGTFISSGVFHHLSLVAIDCRSECWRMVIGFGMMGVGVVAERAFYHRTGWKVSGVIGWIWTMTWLVVWGSFIVEAYARAGLLISPTATDDFMPLRIPVEQLVVGFDRWLHTV